MTNRDDRTPPAGDGDRSQTIVIRERGPHAVWWLIGVSLAVIATCMVLRPAGPGNLALAAPGATAGAHGVFAFTGQLAPDAYGVFMVDVDTGTIWCYRYMAAGNMLKLVAARQWIHDRYLTDYSTEPPTEFIKQLLDQQRANALQRTPAR